jgi:hypothetical protein
MRFMLIRKADEDTEAGAMPSPQVLADMGKYMNEMGKAGIVLAGEGLQPSSTGCRVKFTSGQPAITDGPFIETKELIVGFSIIRVNSRQEAIDWAKRWPTSDAGGNIEIKIRQIIEPEDFGPEATAEMKKNAGPLGQKEMSQPGIEAFGEENNCQARSPSFARTQEQRDPSLRRLRSESQNEDFPQPVKSCPTGFLESLHTVFRRDIRGCQAKFFLGSLSI